LYVIKLLNIVVKCGFWWNAGGQGRCARIIQVITVLLEANILQETQSVQKKVVTL
jgi:hypothetical protein